MKSTRWHRIGSIYIYTYILPMLKGCVQYRTYVYTVPYTHVRIQANYNVLSIQAPLFM